MAQRAKSMAMTPQALIKAPQLHQSEEANDFYPVEVFPLNSNYSMRRQTTMKVTALLCRLALVKAYRI